MFYHLYFMPLIPTMSVWNVAPGRGFGTRWNVKSIVATYLRMWGPVAALGGFVSGVLSVMLVGAVLAALSVVAAWQRGSVAAWQRGSVVLGGRARSLEEAVVAYGLLR